MILTIIVVCEVAFRVVILLGLPARYVGRAPRLGLFLLALAPVVDLVLLISTALHLQSGNEATWHHGLAAVYIGFSIAYGHRMIGWADARFAYHFSGGPKPVRLSGWAHIKSCWADVARTALAAVISAGILLLLAWCVADAGRTAALQSWYPILLMLTAIEVFWAVSYTLSPKRGSGPRRKVAAGRGSP
ncbi:hypothetical protein [Arthrobacter sp. TE12232]